MARVYPFEQGCDDKSMDLMEKKEVLQRLSAQRIPESIHGSSK